MCFILLSWIDQENIIECVAQLDFPLCCSRKTMDVSHNDIFFSLFWPQYWNINEHAWFLRMKLSKRHVPTGCLKQQETARNKRETVKIWKGKKRSSSHTLWQLRPRGEENKQASTDKTRSSFYLSFPPINPIKAYCKSRDKLLKTIVFYTKAALEQIKDVPLDLS